MAVGDAAVFGPAATTWANAVAVYDTAHTTFVSAYTAFLATPTDTKARAAAIAFSAFWDAQTAYNTALSNLVAVSKTISK